MVVKMKVKERRWFGPPGTGKTWRLAQNSIPAAVEKYGFDKVMVTSYTRAAAHEIASRGIPVDESMVGTLHKICYTALGMPELTEAHKDEWNNQCARHERLTLNMIMSVDEAAIENDQSENVGDKIMNQININRARMIPFERWSSTCKVFYEKWRKFKDDNYYMDFADLIESGLKKFPIAPGGPRVIFVDEAQDLTPVQLKLIRNWGQDCDHFILVGDDDQTLYSFTGATPKAFLEPPIENKYKTVLDKSSRVPRTIFEVANKMISQVKTREPKKYTPRDAEGIVKVHSGTWKNPKSFIQDVLDDVKRDMTVMILASCSYMLEPVKSLMLKEAVPFHNPYRRRRGDWNPLARGGGDRITATDLLAAFLSHGPDDNWWTIKQLLRWLKYIRVYDAGLVHKKGKAGIKALSKLVSEGADGLETSRFVFSSLVNKNGIEPALARDINWLSSSLQVKRKHSVQYAIEVYKKNGIDAILKRPKIILGTIHSVKGGEADSVYLFPDISIAAAKEVESTEARESIYRMFYVGMTRAFEKLTLMAPANIGGRRLYVRF